VPVLKAWLAGDDSDEMVIGDERQHVRYENEERVLFPDACAGRALFWKVGTEAVDAGKAMQGGKERAAVVEGREGGGHVRRRIHREAEML